MGLLNRKKTAATPAPRPAPTLRDKLDSAYARKTGAEVLVVSAVTQLKDAGEQLDAVATEAGDKIAELAGIQQAALQSAHDADVRATEIRGVLGE